MDYSYGIRFKESLVNIDRDQNHSPRSINWDNTWERSGASAAP